MSCRFLNRTVASALAIVLFFAGGALADEGRLDRLYAQLQEADQADARRVAREIELEWSKSGSPAMDLLLKRGTDALESGDWQVAIEHLTALTDHAPEFAEGWYRRSLAYAAMDLFGPAVADLERVLALRPRHYGAIATLGGILAKVDKPEMARDAFERALAIHPHYAEVTEALKHLDSQSGETDL